MRALRLEAPPALRFHGVERPDYRRNVMDEPRDADQDLPHVAAHLL